MFPKVSVIIPVFNRANLIVRALDSVVWQTVKPFELIVVDNGSDDSTYEIVLRWINKNKNSGIKYKLLTEHIKGASAARRKGQECSEGDFLYFFDSDDEMKPDLVKEATSKILKEQDIDLVCWRALINCVNDQKRVPPFNPEKPLENHLIHSLLRTQGYMVRKSFLEKCGGWSKDLAVWNDLELGFRLLLLNPKIIGIDKNLVEIFAQKDSITGITFSSKEGVWENTLNEMDKVNHSFFHPQQDKVKNILNYRRAVLAAQYYIEGNKKGAKKLMNVLINPLSNKEKYLLNFVYTYTKLGFRGAWRLVRFAY